MDISGQVIGFAIEVHRHLGPGLLESAYEECPCAELKAAGISYERQVPVPVVYKGTILNCHYRLDLLIDDTLVVEIKSVEHVLPVHKAQLLTYLRLSGHKIGLLMNFHSAVLKDGLHRLIL